MDIKTIYFGFRLLIALYIVFIWGVVKVQDKMLDSIEHKASPFWEKCWLGVLVALIAFLLISQSYIIQHFICAPLFQG